MRHDHTFSLTPDQLSWQHSLALGSSLPVGKSCELNCAILMQKPSTDLHCRLVDPEPGLMEVSSAGFLDTYW